MNKTVYRMLSIITLFALTLGNYSNAGASSAIGKDTNTSISALQTSSTRMLIPLYIYPSVGAWTSVVNANLYKNIDVIINPSNGPGSSKNASYATGVNQLRTGSVGIYGYAYTGKGTRSLAVVKADINNWQLWYGVDGIFLDEADNKSSTIPYYTDLWNYITAKGMKVILNPGTNTIEGYVSIATTNVIYESDPSRALSVPSWYANYPSSKFGVLQYAATVEQMRKFVPLAQSKNIGYIYITDATIDRWSSLPPYLAEEAALLASGSVLPTATTLVNSALPTSRSIPVGTMATIFNTVINAGANTATGVTLSIDPAPAGVFSYQQTDCATNAILGGLNPSLDLAAGGVLCYVLSFTPSLVFAATNVHIRAQAVNAPATNLLPGINTWLLRATGVPGPDIIALTTTTDFHQAACSGTNAFAVALSNVGAAAVGDITVTANTGTAALPLSFLIQETTPATGVVIGDNILQTVGTGENRTVAVFVTFNGCIGFDPAANRVFIEFKDALGNVVGSTSTAVSTGR